MDLPVQWESLLARFLDVWSWRGIVTNFHVFLAQPTSWASKMVRVASVRPSVNLWCTFCNRKAYSITSAKFWHNGDAPCEFWSETKNYAIWPIFKRDTQFPSSVSWASGPWASCYVHPCRFLFRTKIVFTCKEGLPFLLLAYLLCARLIFFLQLTDERR
jgi:hypothetical protein